MRLRAIFILIVSEYYSDVCVVVFGSQNLHWSAPGRKDWSAFVLGLVNYELFVSIFTVFCRLCVRAGDVRNSTKMHIAEILQIRSCYDVVIIWPACSA